LFLFFCSFILSGLSFLFFQEVIESLEQLRLRTAEATLRTEEAERHWKSLITPSGKGNGLSVRFEQYVCEILATGCIQKDIRDTLGPDLCDELVPLASGGVLLHKIQGSMHGTCNTANHVPHTMLELRETSGKLFFGVEEWEALPAADKYWYDIQGIYLQINGIESLKRISKST
jgi:hypothetical protein